MPKSIFDIIKDEFKDLIHVSVENKNVLWDPHMLLTIIYHSSYQCRGI